MMSPLALPQTGHEVGFATSKGRLTYAIGHTYLLDRSRGAHRSPESGGCPCRRKRDDLPEFCGAARISGPPRPTHASVCRRAALRRARILNWFEELKRLVPTHELTGIRPPDGVTPVRIHPYYGKRFDEARKRFAFTWLARSVMVVRRFPCRAWQTSLSSLRRSVVRVQRSAWQGRL